MTTAVKLQNSTTMNLSYRSVGRNAIISGVIGIIASISLFAAVFLPSSNFKVKFFLANMHGVGLIVQFLFMIPVVIGLYSFSNQQLPGMSRITFIKGVVTIVFTILLLLLAFPKIVAAVLYMFPQGLFGLWLMIVCWRMKGRFSQGLRWFGIFVGLGLTLVGVFPLGYAIFVDKIMLQIPAASDEVVAKIPANTANIIVHQFLFVGSFMGVLTFPFWAILLGIRLRREKI